MTSSGEEKILGVVRRLADKARLSHCVTGRKKGEDTLVSLDGDARSVWHVSVTGPLLVMTSSHADSYKISPRLLFFYTYFLAF